VFRRAWDDETQSGAVRSSGIFALARGRRDVICRSHGHRWSVVPEALPNNQDLTTAPPSHVTYLVFHRHVVPRTDSRSLYSTPQIASIWSLAFVESWRIKERSLSHKMGTWGIENRPTYRATASTEARERVWWRRDLKMLSSLPALLMCGAFLVVSWSLGRSSLPRSDQLLMISSCCGCRASSPSSSSSRLSFLISTPASGRNTPFVPIFYPFYISLVSISDPAFISPVIRASSRPSPSP
jgi:hypothetical protein